MKHIINLTPHVVRLNDGTEFPSEGVARVSASFTNFDADGVCRQQFGNPVGLPDPVEGTIFIVSLLVLQACPDRTDLVAPASGHPDTIRDDKGQIVSVPGFVGGGK